MAARVAPLGLHPPRWLNPVLNALKERVVSLKDRYLGDSGVLFTFCAEAFVYSFDRDDWLMHFFYCYFRMPLRSCFPSNMGPRLFAVRFVQQHENSMMTMESEIWNR